MDERCLTIANLDLGFVLDTAALMLDLSVASYIKARELRIAKALEVLHRAAENEMILAAFFTDKQWCCFSLFYHIYFLVKLLICKD